MIYNSEKDRIMLEIRELVNGIETVKDEVDIYSDLMRQLFLSASLEN